MNSLTKHKFTPEGMEQYQFWIKNNPQIARKITSLIKDVMEHPTTGIGKPEALKYDYSGYWSRRITLEHRLIYRFDEDTVYIYSCRYHY